MDKIVLTEFLTREGHLEDLIDDLRALVHHDDTVATIPLERENKYQVQRALSALVHLRAFIIK